MLNVLSLLVVIVAGSYLVALGGLALVAPARAQRYLLGFARTPRLHYLELVVRLAVGLAFLQLAPAMRCTQAFRIFGWLLTATTAVLALVPWQLHRRFAEKTVPLAIQRTGILGIASALLGMFVLVCATPFMPG